MMLEWAAEQLTEITTTALDLEFLPIATNVERGVPNLEFVLQLLHTALWASRVMRLMKVVASTRKKSVGSLAKTAEAL